MLPILASLQMLRERSKNQLPVPCSISTSLMNNKFRNITRKYTNLKITISPAASNEIFIKPHIPTINLHIRRSNTHIFIYPYRVKQTTYCHVKVMKNYAPASSSEPNSVSYLSHKSNEYTKMETENKKETRKEEKPRIMNSQLHAV